MKNNNKGFIAISLIYSFFLVFLVTLLTIVSEYAHNRVLLNAVKKETQEYLSNRPDFNPIKLSGDYEQGDIVPFGSEYWSVMTDEGDSVLLILNRTLTKEEITAAFNEEKEIFKLLDEDALREENVSMCLLNVPLNYRYCGTKVGLAHIAYSWEISTVKSIVDYWLEDNLALQKAKSTKILQEMNFNDGTGKKYNSYIRIPTYDEYKNNEYTDIWHLTGTEKGPLYEIKFEGDEEETNPEKIYRKIRPIIYVKKST